MVNNVLIYLFIIIANTYKAIFRVGSIYKVGTIIPILLMERPERVSNLATSHSKEAGC